jgi:hypothetical protein
MLNLLFEYIPNSICLDSDFSTNQNLTKKVAPDGSFLRFLGNTVVFLLDDEVKEKLSGLQDRLYAAGASVLAHRIEKQTMHMTLHDLVNSPEETPALHAKMEETARKVLPLLERWRNDPPIRMRATWMFNMVNTSIVLGLAPADEGDYARLDDLYCALEQVLPLGYGLTPHITLAYFLPGTYSPGQMQTLREALSPVDLEINLRMEDLVLQTFSDMNHYFHA